MKSSLETGVCAKSRGAVEEQVEWKSPSGASYACLPRSPSLGRGSSLDLAIWNLAPRTYLGWHCSAASLIQATISQE